MFYLTLSHPISIFNYRHLGFISNALLNMGNHLPVLYTPGVAAPGVFYLQIFIIRAEFSSLPTAIAKPPFISLLYQNR